MAEVTGLVLGLMPPLMAAAEAFDKAFKPRDLKLHEAVIERQSLILKNTLEVLLYDSIPPENVKEMLSDTANPKWRDPEIAETLRQRLGDVNYKYFLDSFRGLHETIISLRESLQKIQGKSKRDFLLSGKALRWAAMQDRTRQQLEDVQRHNESLAAVAQTSMYVYQSRQSAQALKNIQDALSNFRDVERIAQNVEAIAMGRITVPEEIDDSISEYSVRTEDENENLTLSYLSLTLETKDEATQLIEQDALLDTGASFCAISVELAQELRLEIDQNTAGGEFNTAILDQTLHTAGKVQLRMRWMSDTRQRQGTKIWVHVIYGLSEPLILSHDFTHNHPEVWNVAKKMVKPVEKLQALWFGKRGTEEEKRQQELRAQQLAKNKARTEAGGLAQGQGSAGMTASVASGSASTDPSTSTTSASGSTKDSETRS
ncbi:hypothetical protein FSARC_14111 [Fusarium sarcochroum]|uniref:Peptidase A2 domain-containing protein n=1 Tax=Fusarium sarcochroum TaxID=1208366 RepID=A0A8H4WQZ0_9HYPO|nr:hypothetical protein FSARC_14111 [Fusarium sarcochroum]